MREKDNIYGIIGTIIFHLCLILLLLFTGLTTPFPPPPEEGVEVNLGYSDQGTGQIQPPKPAQSVDEVVEEQEEQEEIEEVQEEIREHTTGEGERIESKKKTEKEEQEQPEKPKKEKPKVNKVAMYKGINKTNEEVENEGVTGKAGEQGNPFGSPTSTNYVGGGSGNGISFNLGGRTKIKIPEPKKTFSESGTVVVTIYVDKNGNVTRAIPGARGTNANAHLLKLAKEAALKATFNADAEASIEEKGTITYYFILKN